MHQISDPLRDELSEEFGLVLRVQVCHEFSKGVKVWDLHKNTGKFLVESSGKRKGSSIFFKRD